MGASERHNALGTIPRRRRPGAGTGEVYIGHAGGEHDGFSGFYANTVLLRRHEGKAARRHQWKEGQQ